MRNFDSIGEDVQDAIERADTDRIKHLIKTAKYPDTLRTLEYYITGSLQDLKHAVIRIIFTLKNDADEYQKISRTELLSAKRSYKLLNCIKTLDNDSTCFDVAAEEAREFFKAYKDLIDAWLTQSC